MADPSEIKGITPGASLKTYGHGTVAVKFKVNKNIYSISLHDVKHAPEAPNNLLSIGHLTDNGHSAKFMPTGVELKSKTSITFGVGQKLGTRCVHGQKVRDGTLQLLQKDVP